MPFKQSKTDQAKAVAGDYADAAAERAAAARDSLADHASAAGERAGHVRDNLAEQALAGLALLAERSADARSVARDKAAVARDAAQHGVEAAAPHVESARSTLVDEVLPKVAGAIATVAAGALAAKDQASEAAHRAPDAYAVLKGDAKVKSGRSTKLLVALGLAGAAAAYLVVRSKQQQNDPWAVPADDPYAAASRSTFGDAPAGATLKEKAAAAADAAKEKASEAADAVKDKAADLKDAAADKAADLRDAASDKAAEAGGEISDAADAASDALSDAGDNVADATQNAADTAADAVKDAGEQAEDRLN